MRISTSWAQQLGVNSINDLQVKLSQTQMQLSTGKKILTAADDPAGAVRVIDLNQGIKQNTQYQNNIRAANQQLSLEDSILQNASEVLQRIRELGVQGLNATNSAGDKAAIATEMEGLNEFLVGLANTKNANGEYLFAGFKSDVKPFAKDSTNTGAYGYAGDANSRQYQIGETRLVSGGDPGINVFGTPTGATPATVPVPGAMTNVFEAVDKFVSDLKANSPNPASLDDIDASLERMQTVQATVGVRLNALDTQQQINTDESLQLKTILSDTEDLDYAEAISRFNLQNVSLQAAQQAFTQVKNLSLFNFL